MTTGEAPVVVGAYLRPKRSWALPVWDDLEASPLLDLAFHGLGVLPRDVVARRETGTTPPTPPCGRR